MKVGIGICAYNCEDELPRCLDSTNGIYPTILVDKAFRGYANGHSTDSTAEIADSYSNVITLQPKGTMTEAQCRNTYMITSMTFGLDALIVLDTDEYLEFPLGIEFFLRHLDRMYKKYLTQFAFRVTFEDHINGISFAPRIIMNPSFTRYRDRHNQLYYTDKEVITNDKSTKLVMGIIIHEDKKFRSAEREAKMKQRNRSDPTH